jgi:hypothetical protein
MMEGGWGGRRDCDRAPRRGGGRAATGGVVGGGAAAPAAPVFSASGTPRRSQSTAPPSAPLTTHTNMPHAVLVCLIDWISLLFLLDGATTILSRFTRPKTSRNAQGQPRLPVLPPHRGHSDLTDVARRRPAPPPLAPNGRRRQRRRRRRRRGRATTAAERADAELPRVPPAPDCVSVLAVRVRRALCGVRPQDGHGRQVQGLQAAVCGIETGLSGAAAALGRAGARRVSASAARRRPREPPPLQGRPTALLRRPFARRSPAPLNTLHLTCSSAPP